MLSHRNWSTCAVHGRQRGITLIGFLFMLVIVGFFAYLAMRLIPAYTEYMGVVKSMELVRNEPNSATASPEEIRRSLQIKFDTQYVDSQSVPPQAITVLRQGGDATLRVAYEKRIPFAYNVDLVVSFDKSVNLGAAIKAEQALGHAFSDERLLRQAFTHRSAGRPNNERFEFLGDSLLNLIVAELIFESHPRADEGEMTRLRASLVNGLALADRAREESFPERLRLGSGEMKSGGHRRDSILADAYEAVVAAVYLDGGWEACRDAIRSRFGAAVEGAPRHTEKDPKTRLQEWLQSEGLPIPTYELVATRGEEHARVFEAQCRIEAFSISTVGEGSSRRAAEQIAAAAALDQLIEKIDHEH